MPFESDRQANDRQVEQRENKRCNGEHLKIGDEGKAEVDEQGQHEIEMRQYQPGPVSDQSDEEKNSEQ